MTTQPTPAATPRRRPSAGTMTLVLVAMLCTALIAQRATAARDDRNVLTDHGVVAGTDTASAQAPSAEDAIGVSKVRDASGRVVPLVTKGQPAIVMISSRTCIWCKRVLKDLGEMSAGRPLPRLKLLTLEGAVEGSPMTKAEGITGAQLIGPLSARDQARITDRHPGTPTFVEIDANGRVVRTMPGYPIRPELELWFQVMVGAP